MSVASVRQVNKRVRRAQGAGGSRGKSRAGGGGGRGNSSRGHSSVVRSSLREAFQEVSALFFDEERNEIYTGTKSGLVHVWTN